MKNPNQPLSQKPLFTLEEDLSLGGADPRDEYIFTEMNAFVVDDFGRIFILDRRGAHVKVFDADGTYLRTIGRKGQGPGEFLNPIELFMTYEHEIVIEDFVNRRLSFYTLEGVYLRDLPFREMLGKIDMDPEGCYYAMTTESYIPTETGVRIGQYFIKKFDSRLDYLYTLDSSRVPNLMDHFMFYFMLLFDINDDGNIVVGNGREYILKIYDSAGNLIRRIEKAYSPVEVTAGDVREQEESMLLKIRTEVPSYHSAFRSFSWGEEDRIYVRTWEKPTTGQRYFYDVFDSEERYIAKMPLSVEPWIMKNDKLYARDEDENGFHLLKRYKVRWVN